MKCMHCGKENQNTNIRCEFCGLELNPISSQENSNNIVSMSGKKIKYILIAMLIILVLLWIAVEIMFMVVGSHFDHAQKEESKDYVETEGRLLDYDNCRYEDGGELCEAIYEYTVDGQTYQVIPKLLSNQSGFQKTVIVRYDPSNPSKSIVEVGFGELFSIGIKGIVIILLMLILGIVVFCIMFRQLKKEQSCLGL